MRFEDAAREYAVEGKLRGYTEKTIKSQRQRVLAFGTWCEKELGIEEVELVDVHVLKAYIVSLLDRDLKPSTVNTALMYLNSFLRYFYEQGVTGMDMDDPRNRVRRVKEDKPISSVFTRQQVNVMFKACSGSSYTQIRDFCILTFFFDGALRVQELAGIRNQDVLEDGVRIERGKGKKTRIIPLTDNMFKAMMRYERTRKSVFCGRVLPDAYFISQRGTALSEREISHQFKVRGRELEEKGIHVHPHKARHTAAVTLLKSGVDIMSISRFLGHSDIATTQIYLRGLTNDDVLNAVRARSVLGNLS